ncbi:MAG: hypothetical protein KDB14_27660 [Planctomycetales bacterium]|nr:hypothetical protein [Planctomycetales bacterium]
MTSAPHIVFQTSNRRGLGHLMRALNIAHAIRERDSRAQITFYMRGGPPVGLLPHDIRGIVAPEEDTAGHWQSVCDELRPRVVVCDTVPPKHVDVKSCGDARIVFVMRKCVDQVRDELLGHPLVRAAELLLIPHSRQEFAAALPANLEPRAIYVGTICRRPCRSTQAALREKYQLRESDFLLVSTPGGGGFEAEAREFLEVVQRVEGLLRDRNADVRHIVVKGPKCAANFEGGEHLTVVEQEPELPSLLGLASLALSAGGYNTVNEIRAARVPAAYLPSYRRYDDQFERVSELAREGLAASFDVAEKDTPREIVKLCLSKTRMAAMARRCREVPFAMGNRVAAEHILKLIKDACSAPASSCSDQRGASCSASLGGR